MTEIQYDWNAIKANYAPTATVHEWTTLQHIITTYELDIYTKEVWFIKTSGQARIFVSRDGHLAIAHRQGKFSMSTVFEFGDKPATNRKGKTVPIKAICTIKREGYPDAFVHEVYWDEYGSEMSLWGEKPKTMLQKVAECQCLRRAFDMHGFYAQEEFPDEMPGQQAPMPTPEPKYTFQKYVEKANPDIKYAELPNQDIPILRYVEQANQDIKIQRQQPAKVGVLRSADIPSDWWCSESEIESYTDNFKAQGLDADAIISKGLMDNGRYFKNAIQKAYEKAVQVEA